MFKSIVTTITALSIFGCGSSTIDIQPSEKYLSNIQVSDAETGFFLAFAPCTLAVSNKTTLVVRYDANASNWCINHPECKSCKQVSNTLAHASQEYDVDGDGTFYVGK